MWKSKSRTKMSLLSLAYFFLVHPAFAAPSKTWDRETVETLIPTFTLKISGNQAHIEGELPKSCLDLLEIKWITPKRDREYDPSCGQTIQAIQFLDEGGKAEACIGEFKAKGPFTRDISIKISPGANWKFFRELDSKIQTKMGLTKSGDVSILHWDESIDRYKCDPIETYQTEADKKAAEDQAKAKAEEKKRSEREVQIELHREIIATCSDGRKVKTAIDQLLNQFHDIDAFEANRLHKDFKERSRKQQFEALKEEINRVGRERPDEIESLREELAQWSDEIRSKSTRDAEEREAAAKFSLLAAKLCSGAEAKVSNCDKAISIMEREIFDRFGDRYRESYEEIHFTLKINRLHAEAQQGNASMQMIKLKELQLTREWTRLQEQYCSSRNTTSSEACSRIRGKRVDILKTSQIAQESLAIRHQQVLAENPNLATDPTFGQNMPQQGMMPGMGMNNPMMMPGMGMNNPMMMQGMGMGLNNPMMMPGMGMGLNNPMMMQGMGMGLNNPMMMPGMGMNNPAMMGAGFGFQMGYNPSGFGTGGMNQFGPGVPMTRPY